MRMPKRHKNVKEGLLNPHIMQREKSSTRSFALTIESPMEKEVWFASIEVSLDVAQKENSKDDQQERPGLHENGLPASAQL